jgi:hypothetical protein
MTGKSGAGQGSKRFDKVQIVVRGGYVDMTHIGGQERELRLYFNAGAIPSKQGVNCEAVAKIMNAWQPPVRLLNLRHLEK